MNDHSPDLTHKHKIDNWLIGLGPYRTVAPCNKNFLRKTGMFFWERHCCISSSSNTSHCTKYLSTSNALFLIPFYFKIIISTDNSQVGVVLFPSF